MIRLLAFLPLMALLAGCGTGFSDIGRAPAMSPIGSGLEFAQTPEMALYPRAPRAHPHGFSLWNDSQAALFKDARAMQVGDILTVLIDIDDKATFDNQTDHKRDSKTGLSIDGSIDAGISGSANGALNFGSNTSTKGDGSIERSEKLHLRVAAVVTGILANGNLVISGSQEVRVNQELRILNVAGIVRPRDVNADNTISYAKIAEARISYGGRGRLSEVQHPPIGQQIVNKYSPI
ncbi:MAG TPA: flagellar basal body L-ring protein FlgH [Pararhizobium sp.]|jgi:flagellar L-ring protein precursor FlgH|nr:flagellar basal body L-ring protein FlgH [Pararhizobium sp.]